jgi:hypothetical protein
MVGSHLVISAVVTAAALAGCLAYLLSPPIPSVAVDQQPHLGKLTLGAPDAMALRGPDWQPVENEKSSDGLLGSRPGNPQASINRAGVSECRGDTDQTGRIPLPRKRPIPRI